MMLFVCMIYMFEGHTELVSIGEIIGELEGSEIGSIIVVGLYVDSIVESSLQVVLNVADIAIGLSVIILSHVASV